MTALISCLQSANFQQYLDKVKAASFGFPGVHRASTGAPRFLQGFSDLLCTSSVRLCLTFYAGLQSHLTVPACLSITCS